MAKRTPIEIIEDARKSGKPIDSSVFEKDTWGGKSSSTRAALSDLLHQDQVKAQARKMATGSARATDPKQLDSYKRGGLVRKTGVAKLHKGERVLTRAQSKKTGMR